MQAKLCYCHVESSEWWYDFYSLTREVRNTPEIINNGLRAHSISY